MIAHEIYRFKQTQAARHRGLPPQIAPQGTAPILNRDQVESIPREWAELHQPNEDDLMNPSGMIMDLDSELSQRQLQYD